MEKPALYAFKCHCERSEAAWRLKVLWRLLRRTLALAGTQVPGKTAPRNDRVISYDLIEISGLFCFRITRFSDIQARVLMR